VEGLPSPRQRLLYTLPLSSPRVRGSFFLPIGINRAVIQRTWGLHELEARRLSTKPSANATDNHDALEASKRLTYGRQFKYEEFIVMPNAAVGFLVSIALAIGLASLTFMPPVGNLMSYLRGPSLT
jgi:hypothetical protein